MNDPLKILTVEDVAEYLRADKGDVLRLIEKGDIPSFDVGGHPRVQYGALSQWFQHAMHMRELDQLRERIEDSKEWAKVLDKDPALKSQILEEEHSQGTFGAFLKDAAQLTDEERQEAETTLDTEPTKGEDSRDVTANEDFLYKLRQQPIVAGVLTVGVMVIAIGTFTDALSKIWDFISRLAN